MSFRPTLTSRAVIAVLGLVSLTACSSSDGGGGTGGGTPPPANPADFLAQLENVQGRAPTSDMPISGSASYTGAVLLDITTDSETLRGLGDFSFSTTFEPVDGSGVAANSVSNAQISNLSGESSAGEAFDWDLTLTQAEAEAAEFESVVGVTEFTVPVPGFDDITTRTGSLSISVLGDVTAENAPELGGEGTMLVTLGGTFFGPGGEAAAGSATVVFDDAGVGLFDATGNGSFYAEN